MEKKVNLHANHRQRLKKRALLEGLDNFEPHNALELMLFYALPHVDTNDIAHELINRFGSFDAVFDAPIEELVKVKGIKDQAATFIKLMPEFCRYYFTHNRSTFVQKPTYDDIGKMFTKAFVGKTEESVACIFLDKDGNYITTKFLFTGSIHSVGFSIRAVIDETVKCGAYKIALAHNHPSRSPVASVDDLETTNLINEALEKVGIELIESFVVTKDYYFGVRAFIKKQMKEMEDKD